MTRAQPALKPMTLSQTTRTLDEVLNYFRPAVRSEKPYIVGGVPDVTVKLNQNECPLDLPKDLKAELADTFLQISLNRYPNEQPDALRYAIAQHVGWDADGILVGNGSNELTYTFGLCFIDSGTPVVLPRPMFSLYEKVARLFDADLTQIAPRDDLRFDVPAILDAIQRTQPALVVLTTPNNPTGLSLPLEDVQAVVEASPGMVVVDEAYVEFTEEVSAQTILADHPNLILLRTFSKACGLAGMRLGFLLAHPAVITEMMKSRLPFMVDRLSEATALALLKHPDLIDQRTALLKTERQKLSTSLAAFDGVSVVPSQANFLLFRTPLAPETVMQGLGESGVLVRNMGGYPELRGYLRVNAGTPDENKAFLVALKQVLS